MAYGNGGSKRSSLHPDLQVKVFRHGRREWTEARLREVEPGQEFIAFNRLFRVLRPEVYAEDVLLDVAKIPEADRPHVPANWRTPKSHDVVYAFDEDARPAGHCLLGNLNPGQRCVFQGLVYHIKPGPSPDTCTLVGKGEVYRHGNEPRYVWVEYTAQDALGKADIGYRYPLGQLIPLANGDVVGVEELQPGMHFVLEGGGVATATKVDQPTTWPPPDPEHDRFGNAPRGVIGTFKYTGWVQLIEMRCGGAVHEVSPGHLYWSETRRGWYPIGSFAVGELLRTRDNRHLPVQSITPPRWVHETVYNYEVDEYHTYFVGGGDAAVWAHNGMGEVGCGVPKAARAESGKKASAGRVGLSEDPSFAAGWEAIFGKQSLFKAPQPGKGQRLLEQGFHPSDFAEGDRRAYFFTRGDGEVRTYAYHYGEGILEVQIPREVYNQRIRRYEQLYQGGPEIEVPIPHSEFDVLNNARRILHEHH
jgi:hypothetical protein